MNPPPFRILLEDNHLLVVDKPAGLPTMGVASDRPSLLAMAKTYIKQRYDKPGNVYLGIVSRLDAPVTGIVILARTSKAARRLTEQFRNRTVRKRYWALVARPPIPPEAKLIDWLRKHERHRKVLVTRPDVAGSQEARLAYRTLGRVEQATLLEIELETGRKHQIRVQLAARNLPILGDRKYGSLRQFSAGIALHARQLEFNHPVQETRIQLESPVPASWHPFGVRH